MQPLLFLRGRCLFSVPLSPSRPDPCLFSTCLSSSFPVWCFRRRRVSLSLSVFLSQALGKPKPFWFGLPLVFLRPGRVLRHRSVHLPLPLHQGSAPAPVFFFFAVARAGLFLRFWFSGGVAVRGCFRAVGGLGSVCAALLYSCICLALGKTALPGTRPQRRLPPFPPPIGLSGVTRLLLGVVPWTGRSVAGWECRRFCDPTTSRTLTTIIIIVRPGHRRPPPNRPRPFRQCRGLLGVSVFCLQRNIRGRTHFSRVFIPLKSCIFSCAGVGTLLWSATVLSHRPFSPFSKGEMLSVFSILFFFVSGSASFVVFFRSSFLRFAF